MSSPSEGPGDKGAHRYTYPRSPVANQGAVIGGKDVPYRFTLLTPSLLRYEWAPDCSFEDRASTFALNRSFAVPKFRVIERKDATEHGPRLEIITESLHLRYDGKAFSPSGLTADILGGFTDHGATWRYGESEGYEVSERGNMGGTWRTLDDIDGPCPLGPGVVSRAGYAVLDDSNSMLFDSSGWIASRQPAVNGEERIDGYLFAYGHDFPGAVKAFYAVSGQQPLLPRWSLGNWWSRYYPYSADEYLRLMDRFREEGVPFSVGTLDMDWHLVHDERVQGSGWTGYTWNKKLFPSPEAFLTEMKKRSLKVPLNDHPAGGVRQFEDLYKEMAQALDHDTSNGDPILFDIANRKFADAFFDILHRRIEDQGVDFWWIDWQQGTHSSIANIDPLWVLNHYHYLDNSLGGKRPLILSRFGGPGSHRYPVGFSGDAHITWKSLAWQPEFTATASNVGYGWWSHDIGGHLFGYRSEELSARWVQFGCFSPILRLHSSENPFITKEPWTFGAEARGVMERFLRFRHRLVPYLYAMNVRSAREGVPLVQPIYWAYPARKEAYAHRNNYFFGSELLVFPIVEPEDRDTKMGSVMAWLPPGKHVDIFSEVVYTGDRTLRLHRGLDEYPVLAREGSIIPLDGKKEPENGCPAPTEFEVLIVVGKDAEFVIWEDDGRGGDTKDTTFVATKVSWKQEEGTVTVTYLGAKGETDPVAPDWLPAKRHWKFRFLSLAPQEPHLASNTILVENVPITKEVRVQIGANPSLAPNPVSSLLLGRLQRAEVMYEAKRAAWAVVEQKALSAGAKIAALAATGIPKGVESCVVEVLVADE